MLKNALRDYPLSRMIRQGKCGTCPKLLTQFLKATGMAANTMPREQNRQVHIEALDIILDTICDPLIAKCWRGWCLDNCYIPLTRIRELSWTDGEKRELHQIEAELRRLSQYFL